jgi:hypothetical protein
MEQEGKIGKIVPNNSYHNVKEENIEDTDFEEAEMKEEEIEITCLS